MIPARASCTRKLHAQGEPECIRVRVGLFGLMPILMSVAGFVAFEAGC